MAFGLASILITLGVIVFFLKASYLPQTQADLNAQKKANDQIQTIAGRDDNGVPVEQTYSLYTDTLDNGKVKDFQVTQINPGSPMEKFGLQANDVIIAAVGDHGLKTEMQGADEADGKAAIREAFTNLGLGGQLIIKRGNQTLALPGGTPVASAGAPATPAAPAQPAGQPPAPKPMGADPGGSTEDNPLGGINGRLHALPTN
jgi:hypothetical protein